MKQLIVIPTFNERENLARLLARVRAAAPHADIVVVDDNSPDRTGALGEELARGDAHLRIVHRPGKLGLGTAYCEAFRRGLAEGYEQFVQMDADLSHAPEDLPAFFSALDEGADVVVGSRHIAGGGIVGWGLDRHLLSKGGSLYARSILGLGVSDLTSGYKAFTRRALDAIDLSKVYSCGYSYQIEMVYRAIRRGMLVREIPIQYAERARGESKMGSALLLEALASVWRLRLGDLDRPPAGRGDPFVPRWRPGSRCAE
jgi:dolichol-phosphate mannosyltransferase